jgi:hypothetical protein
LAIGSLIAFVPEQRKSEIAAFAGLSSILTAVLVFDDNLPDPSFYTLLPTLGTALFILFSSQTTTATFLSKNNLVNVGLVSYSAYLIHQPVFAFYRIQSLRPLYTNDFVVLILVVLVLSGFTWRFVENPFRDRKKVKLQILGWAFVVSVLLLCALFLISPSYHSKSSIEINLTNQKTDLQNYQPNPSHIGSNASTKLTPYIAVYNGTHVPVDYNMAQCHNFHSQKSDERNPLFCRIGANKYTAPPTYFLTGDSMSFGYAIAFDTLPGSGVYATIGNNCPTTLIRPNSPKKSVTAAGGYRCWLFHKQVFSYIKNRARTIKKVFVSSNWFFKLDENSYLDVIFAIQKYAALNVALYLIEQPPVQPLDPYQVMANLRRLNNYTNSSIRANSLSMQQLTDYDTQKYQPFLKRVHENTTAAHVYVRSYFCDAECCPMGTTDELFYNDNTHIAYTRPFILNQLFLSIL